MEFSERKINVKKSEKKDAVAVFYEGEHDTDFDDYLIDFFEMFGATLLGTGYNFETKVRDLMFKII